MPRTSRPGHMLVHLLRTPATASSFRGSVSVQVYTVMDALSYLDAVKVQLHRPHLRVIVRLRFLQRSKNFSKMPRTYLLHFVTSCPARAARWIPIVSVCSGDQAREVTCQVAACACLETEAADGACFSLCVCPCQEKMESRG